MRWSRCYSLPHTHRPKTKCSSCFGLIVASSLLFLPWRRNADSSALDRHATGQLKVAGPSFDQPIAFTNCGVPDCSEEGSAELTADPNQLVAVDQTYSYYGCWPYGQGDPAGVVTGTVRFTAISTTAAITFQHIRSAAIVSNYLREIHRVLRPGGYFRLQVHDKSDPEYGDAKAEAQPGEQCGFYGNAYEPDQLKELLERHRYDVEAVTSKGRWIWATAKRPFLAVRQQPQATLELEPRAESAPRPIDQHFDKFVDEVAELVEKGAHREAVAYFEQHKSKYTGAAQMPKVLAIIEELRAKIGAGKAGRG